MAEKPLKSIKFPGLEDVYKVPEGSSGGSGADGYSPVAKVEETSDGAKITITDKTGTTEATVKNGKDGNDGYSPQASVAAINGGAKIIITDKNGTTSVNVMNGSRGPAGDDGTTPTIGENGNWYLGTEDTGKPSRGEKGAPGDAGTTPNIQIGTVTTLDAGSDATASMGGTAENPLLNLGIPKGEKGDSEGGSGGTDISLGVTGASAGQIAKITAVDENGKPTAWTPVDMPGGGKTWEKIGEWTIPEGSQSISLNQQIENLNTYQQIKVFARFPVIANTAAKFRVGILFGGTSMWVIYNAAFSASRAIVALVSLFVYDDKFAVESCAADMLPSGETFYGLSTNNSYALRKNLIDNDKYRPSALSGIRIDVQNSTTDYLDGANIVMYGVRA